MVTTMVVPPAAIPTAPAMVVIAVVAPVIMAMAAVMVAPAPIQEVAPPARCCSSGRVACREHYCQKT